MDALFQTSALNLSSASPALRDGVAFLSENPEAFGAVSDAYPVVTDDCIIAANGSETGVRVVSRPYPAGNGIDGLYDTVFADILPRSPLTASVLAGTFGAAIGGQEYPIARYAAVLSEAVAAEVLSGMPAEATHGEIARRLGEAIPRALAGLRANLGQDEVPPEDDTDLLSVSFAACRTKHLGDRHYTIDLFFAGDYRAYLLDKDGLRPLHIPASEPLSFDTSPALTGNRFKLYHPDAFAVLLLSGSACAVNSADRQSLAANPGLAWRYRMRLEANILRILTALSKESDFGARATQFFTGRANGRDSASGAISVFRKDDSFSAFRADCLARLRHLEDMIALLPDGYDPTRVPSLPSRVENEHNYIRRLLTQEAGLSERTAEALRILALEKLTSPDETAWPLPADVPHLRRLSPEDIADVFRIYDAENAEDYAYIRQNRAALRGQLADHWVTLRPILLRVSEGEGAAWEPDEAELTDNDIAYKSLLRLNARLGKHYAEREHCMTAVSEKLEQHIAILRSRGKDWLHAHGEDEVAALWADTAAADLSAVLRGYADTYERTEDEYRSLLADYTADRERLFSLDAEDPDGFFAADWEAILHGRLSEGDWGRYRTALAAETDGDSYVRLWDELCIISHGTGARQRRIEARSVERRTARDISERTEFQIAAIRASAYQDPDWGEEVCDLLDDAHRANYFTMVRRWQETCELMTRQAAAYEEYRRLYEDD